MLSKEEQRKATAICTDIALVSDVYNDFKGISELSYFVAKKPKDILTLNVILANLFLASKESRWINIHRSNHFFTGNKGNKPWWTHTKVVRSLDSLEEMGLIEQVMGYIDESSGAHYPTRIRARLWLVQFFTRREPLVEKIPYSELVWVRKNKTTLIVPTRPKKKLTAVRSLLQRQNFCAAGHSLSIDYSLLQARLANPTDSTLKEYKGLLSSLLEVGRESIYDLFTLVTTDLSFGPPHLGDLAQEGFCFSKLTPHNQLSLVANLLCRESSFRRFPPVSARFLVKLVESVRDSLILQKLNICKELRQICSNNVHTAGRLYGPAWQHLPSSLRGFILINDQPTVELDYSAQQLHILYAKAGCKAPEGDLYDVGPYPRPYIKKLVAALLNAESEEKALVSWRAKKTKSGWVKDPVPKELALRGEELVQLIYDKHPAIRKYFGASAWKITQTVDSQIAMHILDTLLSKNILALPIHDSFIVQERYYNDLKEAMTTASVDILGRAIPFQ